MPMSRKSIRTVTATARREANIALKHHIKGHMWVDTVTANTHLQIFSEDYLVYFRVFLEPPYYGLPLAEAHVR